MKISRTKIRQYKPYEQLPFQYSIHVILNADFDWKTNKNIKHYAFLSSTQQDSRYQLAKQLIIDLKSHGEGTFCCL